MRRSYQALIRYLGCAMSVMAGLAAHGEDTRPAPAALLQGKSHDVSVAEMAQALHELSAADQHALLQDDGMLRQWVETQVVQRWVCNEALAKEWDKRPEVRKALARVLEATLADNYLKATFGTEAKQPTEEELRKLYDQQRANFFVPRSYHLAQIFIKKEGERSSKRLAEVQEALTQPDNDFANIAQRFSEDAASAAHGGDIGWLTDTQIQPEIHAKLPELKLRLVSEPILLADGWHIFKVTDVQEAHTLTLEQVRDTLIQEWRNQTTQAGVRAYLAKLLKEHPAAITEGSLSELRAQLRP